MDFDLTETEQAVRDGIRAVLDRHAGVDRAREVEARSGYDAELEAALWDAGYLHMAHDPDAGMVAATMLVEEVAAAAGSVPIGTLALVLPALGLDDLRGPVAIARPDSDAPVRYASLPGHVLLVDDDEVAVHEMAPGAVVDSLWGYPFGRLVPGPCVLVLDGAGPSALAWWRLAVAAEIVGAAGAGLALTIDHLNHRMQFGRPLGALQSLQHRLAALRVRIEGSRWLTYRAAWEGAPDESVLVATAQAVGAGRTAVRELHQMSGAMGLTDEYDLHLWTTRIFSLAAELGGPPVLQQALARARWEVR
ncbi:MAG: acyl-CoA dehydrogenase [Acidimicrobiia bacterium]